MAITIFDYINSIDDKKYLYEDGQGYNSYMVNKAYSFHPDTILIANEANFYQLDGKIHYDFMYRMIDKKKRYTKWFKEEKNDEIQAICEYYGVTKQRAIEYMSILSHEEVKEIMEINNVK